jgi:uncharacterized membrane protein YhaH (DUF805 family)
MKEKNVIDRFQDVLRKYTVFKGRASRAEFWSFIVVSFFISMILTIFERFVVEFNSNILESLYSFAILIPSLAVYIRRLHDTNKSGWYLLLFFVPVIGWILLFVFLVEKGTEGENKYGENPV